MNETVDFRKLILPPNATALKAVEVMTGSAGIALVAKKDRRLLGIVVDYDLRKAMLKGFGLDAPISQVMNIRPVTLPPALPREELVRFFRRDPRANIPLVDAGGKVVGLARMADYLAPGERSHWVVLMAGGAGRRLYPLTQDRPKPLLPVGNKPILETIVEQFASAGFKRFFLALNHHGEQIEGYFKDGSRLGVEIRYLREKKRLGTAGALSLLPRTFSQTLIVMNGDLLTKIDFEALLDFHKAEKNLATLCVREYDFQVPYGVVQMEDHKLSTIVEKPAHRFFVNAGIYALEPQVLGLVPKNSYFEMPALLEKVNAKRKNSVGCFPIREYWIDIGQPGDYQRAVLDYPQVFERQG